MSTATALPDSSVLRAALKNVADPEIGANIIDLGLVYDLVVEPGRVVVTMTLTSPACPMGGLIVDDARSELQRLLPPETAIDIEVVWSPAWTPALMSPACRERLGWSDE